MKLADDFFRLHIIPVSSVQKHFMMIYSEIRAFVNKLVPAFLNSMT